MTLIPAPERSTTRRPEDVLLSGIAATAITLYQHYLSPRKGFSCPHRLLHGGPSCSGHVKHLILEEGLFEAVAPSRQRLAACREARYTLGASTVEAVDSSWFTGWWRRRRHRRHGCCDIGCDVCDIFD